MDFEEMLAVMRALMPRGLQSDCTTGKSYYTGYAYNSLYDWDQYFEGLVQLYMGWGTQLLRSGVDIFLLHQHADGFIPRAIDPPELKRPHESSEMVKPFLCQILVLCLQTDGQIDFLKTDNRFDGLTAYLLYWLDCLDPTGSGLSRWRSAPHTGMDNQRERAGDWDSDFCMGVDLNAYLCRELRAYITLARAIGRNREADLCESRFEERKKVLLDRCWDEESGFFYDVDARTGRRMSVRSIAGFMPMWAGVATPGQAERLVREHLKNPEEFDRPYPVPAYSAGWDGYSAMYLPGDIGCAWRCNTWIPTNYMVFEGLRLYGYTRYAEELARKTFALAAGSGFREYYGSEEGIGCGLSPFWGWSFLAAFMPYEMKTGYNPNVIDGTLHRQDFPWLKNDAG